MSPHRISGNEFARRLTDPIQREALASMEWSLILVDAEEPPAGIDPRLTLQLPVVIACVVDSNEEDRSEPEWCDVVIPNDPAAVAELSDGIQRAPLAAAALALHLRGTSNRTVPEGLIAESTLYSLLQAGPEFQAWRHATPAHPQTEPPDQLVRMRRDGDTFTIELNNPERRNSISPEMRDALSEPLDLALVDRHITDIQIFGAGPVFCSGGDLDTFGQFVDPVSAHRVRMTRSLPLKMHELEDRLTVNLHGAAIGGGIELAAFAGHVRATPDTQIWLPELGYGLIPGAGGTVSLPARIGRHKTALLAFTQRRISGHEAAAWGLVDELVSPKDSVT